MGKLQEIFKRKQKPQAEEGISVPAQGGQITTHMHVKHFQQAIEIIKGNESTRQKESTLRMECADELHLILAGVLANAFSL